MNPVVLVVSALALIGLLFILLPVWARKSRGLGRGETVALDNVTLFSARHKLVGRPDRIVKQGNTYIPEEWKSARRVSRGHELQLGAYFLLVEERYGARPPHGFIVLGDGSRVKVVNADALRAEVLSIATLIRERRRELPVPIPVRQPPNKCSNCGQRANCGQTSG